MRLFTITRYMFVGLSLLRFSSAGKYMRRSNLVDDVIGFFENEEEFYEEEPIAERRVSSIELVDEDAIPSRDRPTLVNRQMAAAAGNPQVAAAVPVPSIQPQNLTTVQNNTLNNTSGQPSGYVGVAPDQTQQVNCTILSTGLSSNCWADLDLTSWLKNWTATHYCYPNEGFSTCFLRQNYFPGYDCSGIAANRCVPPQAFPWQDVYSFYVSYNIYCELPKSIARHENDNFQQ